ncbi:hypothetical protein SASPL_110731 [Salvia splendens]|uniref:E3 ubiquitin-protein ligase RFWD2 n=1 Tax=Salvia splendens TaxID=180675 RepID=A0A8X9A2N8_SALSN|nr:WD repeat-containing protein RUP2-like [Salvia splendens]KAG6426507.1 hypothetical protein SASPL_110731 [Salvia splendens]
MINSSADTPCCDWDFNLTAVISYSSPSSDAIGVLEFDPTNSLLATGGIARKIRIYTAANLPILKEGCDYCIYTPAKLSSLKWRPSSGSRLLGSGDYDGVVMEYDLERRLPVFERDEHGGRRVWSIDYSAADPALGASTSDDGTMQMWDTRCDAGTSVATVRPDRSAASPVCCVEFDPIGGPTVVLGCADRRIYGYDARRAVEPIFVLEGHEKAVSYARFMDSETIVSSSIDGSLMTWHVEDRQLIRRYRGHVNSRRFVGLSVWRGGGGGLLSCGSENNRVFVYDRRWGDPIWACGFEAAPQQNQGFVSSVCWRQTAGECCTLVAGGSDGVLKVFEGRPRPRG